MQNKPKLLKTPFLRGRTNQISTNQFLRKNLVENTNINLRIEDLNPSKNMIQKT